MPGGALAPVSAFGRPEHGVFALVRCFASRRNSIHPLRSPEIRALRQIQRDYADTSYTFVSERKAPLSTRSIRHIIARAGELAGIPFQVHPHQRSTYVQIVVLTGLAPQRREATLPQ